MAKSVLLFLTRVTNRQKAYGIQLRKVKVTPRDQQALNLLVPALRQPEVAGQRHTSPRSTCARYSASGNPPGPHARERGYSQESRRGGSVMTHRERLTPKEIQISILVWERVPIAKLARSPASEPGSKTTYGTPLTSPASRAGRNSPPMRPAMAERTGRRSPCVPAYRTTKLSVLTRSNPPVNIAAMGMGPIGHPWGSSFVIPLQGGVTRGLSLSSSELPKSKVCKTFHGPQRPENPRNR